MTNNLASAKENKMHPKYGLVPAGNGESFGYNSPKHPAYVHYADSLLPSVGDTACYEDTDGQIHHCGLIIGIVELLVPRHPPPATPAGPPSPACLLLYNIVNTRDAIWVYHPTPT